MACFSCCLKFSLNVVKRENLGEVNASKKSGPSASLTSRPITSVMFLLQYQSLKYFKKKKNFENLTALNDEIFHLYTVNKRLQLKVYTFFVYIFFTRKKDVFNFFCIIQVNRTIPLSYLHSGMHPFCLSDYMDYLVCKYQIQPNVQANM